MSAGLLRRSGPPPERSDAGGRPAGSTVPEPALEWGRNPWRESVGAALAGAAVLATLAVLLVALSRPIGAPPATMVVLVLLLGHSLSPSWWPSRYQVDGRGVAAREPFVWRRIPWSAIRRARIAERPARRLRRGGRTPGQEEEALCLSVSTLLRPGRLDAFRGMVLPIPGGPDRERVLSGVRERLSLHGF